MLKFLKNWKGLEQINNRFFNWLFDANGCRSELVYKSSITGEPLMVITRHGSLRQTDKGLQGSTVSVFITQFGEDCKQIIGVLNGDYDSCLDKKGKEAIVENIKQRVSEGGRYTTTKRNPKGTLDFVSEFWSNQDLETIKELLKEKGYA